MSRLDLELVKIQVDSIQDIWDTLTKTAGTGKLHELHRAGLANQLINSIPWALKTITELMAETATATVPEPPSEAPEHQLKPFWISWYQTATMPGFTLNWPWWYTGWAGDGTTRTIVAAVIARDEDAAEDVILSSFDVRPGGVMWRFNEERDDGWSPFCDRFPKADWMSWPGTNQRRI